MWRINEISKRGGHVTWREVPDPSINDSLALHLVFISSFMDDPPILSGRYCHAAEERTSSIERTIGRAEGDWLIYEWASSLDWTALACCRRCNHAVACLRCDTRWPVNIVASPWHTCGDGAPTSLDVKLSIDPARSAAAVGAAAEIYLVVGRADASGATSPRSDAACSRPRRGVCEVSCRRRYGVYDRQLRRSSTEEETSLCCNSHRKKSLI